MSGQQPLPFPEGGGGVMAARDDVIAAALSLAAATWALNARVEAGDPWAAADLAFAHERLDEALAAYVRDETAGRPAEAAGRAERVNPPPFVAGFNPAAPVPPQQPSAWREEVGDVFDGLRYLSVVTEGLALPELSTDPSDLERLPEVEDGGGVVERAAPQSGGAS